MNLPPFPFADAQRTFREIMYLQALHGQPNIVQLQDILKAENDRDIYIVTDFMESDLHAAIKSNILLEVHKQYIIYQLLRALKFMHSGDLIHRDIKPSNILLNSDCTIKLCDFGLARSVQMNSSRSSTNSYWKVDEGSSITPIMTDYVATRWYRSPEILFASSSYTTGVDLWAVGCLLGEMILGSPVFPGTSTIDQIERILELTGRPNSADIASINSPSVGKLMETIRPPSRSKAVNWYDVFPGASDEAIEFLQQCFRFNPTQRPAAAKLLSNTYLRDFRDPPSETECPSAIRIPIDDNVKLSVSDYRGFVYEEIVRRKMANKKSVQKSSLGLPNRRPETADSFSSYLGNFFQTINYTSK